MSYNDPAPADPVAARNNYSVYPSSPPDIDESQQGVPSFPTTSSGLPILPSLKIRIKLGRETPTSSTQVMSSVAYVHGNADEERDTSGDDNFQNFSGVNANAVRSQLESENTGSEADEPSSEMTTPKNKKKRASTSTSSGAKKSAKKGGNKRGRKAKETKKDVKEDGAEGEEEELDATEEVYEVERIMAHDWDIDGNLIYKVKWVGYGPEYDTFEPESMLEAAKQRIEEYKRSLPVETREELKMDKTKKVASAKKGRPSKGAAKSSGKRPRSDSLPEPSDDESEVDEKDDDDDFELEKPAGSTSRSRGRATKSTPKSKGELKLFATPKSTGPPKKRQFLENRQNWLEETDSDSDADTKKVKTERRVTESPAPKKETSTGKRGRPTKVEEDVASTSNGTAAHSSTRGSSGATIEGMYRHEGSGEVDVVLTEGRGGQRILPLREAFDAAGFGLVQFLVDRIQFN